VAILFVAISDRNLTKIILAKQALPNQNVAFEKKPNLRKPVSFPGAPPWLGHIATNS